MNLPRYEVKINIISLALEITFWRLTNATKWKRDLKKYTTNTKGVNMAHKSENSSVETGLKQSLALVDPRLKSDFYKTSVKYIYLLPGGVIIYEFGQGKHELLPLIGL